jgi:hypothetical protein
MKLTMCLVAALACSAGALPVEDPRRLQDAATPAAPKKATFSLWSAAKNFFKVRESTKAKMSGTAPPNPPLSMSAKYGVSFKAMLAWHCAKPENKAKPVCKLYETKKATGEVSDEVKKAYNAESKEIFKLYCKEPTHKSALICIQSTIKSTMGDAVKSAAAAKSTKGQVASIKTAPADVKAAAKSMVASPAKSAEKKAAKPAKLATKKKSTAVPP